MRLKLSLRNSAKSGLFLNLLLVLSFLCGCSISTTPTYTKDKLTTSIEDICKKEYGINVKAKIVGETLWVYLPLRNIIVKKDKPSKTTDIFEVKNLKEEFKDKAFKLEYTVKKVPPKETLDDSQINKDAADKIGNLWKVIRRVVFSLEHSKDPEPKFYCMVAADIKKGFEIKITAYYLDLKKVSYSLISSEEYQHRTIQDVNIDPAIIDDRRGVYLEYKDISMEEFIANQIIGRIKLKFQKPEVNKHADIDKEVLKIVLDVFKIYGFEDFDSVELSGKEKHLELLLNKVAIWEKAKEYGF